MAVSACRSSGGWVLRFNEADPDGLIDRKAPGNPPLLTDAQRAALAQVVEAGPKPYLDGVVRWRLVDLAEWVWEEFGVSISRQTLGRELRGMGFRKLSARPRHHAQDPDALIEFKKAPRPPGGDPGRAPGRHRDRTVVAGRGAHRPEKQDHPPVGAARNPAAGAA